MRHHASLPLPAPATGELRFWVTVKSLLPYIWAWPGRVALALVCLVAAKLANVSVPIVFKHLVDSLDATHAQAWVLVPAAMVAIYGVLRFSTSFFTELREILFARVTQQAVRRISIEVFQHLHRLSLRFHLERQTGGLTRDIERGTRSIGSLLSFTLYNIVPTIVEIVLVLGVLFSQYAPEFGLITIGTLVIYIVFTIKVTGWRTTFRRQANELDSAANSRAIDSLLNFETVKYFNNEDFERARYDEQLGRWVHAQIKNQFSLSVLNMGQALIIALGVTAIMWRATVGVANGSMSLGDIVLVNGFMVQLYIPLNFLGVIYREIRQSLIDIERLFGLLKTHQEIQDAPDAEALQRGALSVHFDAVHFAYDPKRPILQNVSFTIPAGKTLAVVGHSGSGKSTLARLLFRFYDVQQGKVCINERDIRSFTQQSVRSLIAIVPQDTVLFNDTIYYNIHYGRPEASNEEVLAAARAAHLHEFISQLPEGYETRVGERGLKLSGGEKQRVAIARALLKDPSILVFDEATSALDSKTEKNIQAEIRLAAQGRTTLIIAHRLSTIMHADEIVVMEHGQILERGRHQELLAHDGPYAQMWALQQREEAAQTEVLVE